MTALTLPTSQLVRADVLKLRKRRGLAVVVGVLTVVSATLTYTIIELLHISNAGKYGVAGGESLGTGVELIVILGATAAALVGATAGLQDLDAGVYRDLVVTGRSRAVLFRSRLLGGLAYLLPFVAAAYTITSIASVVLAGDKPSPSAHLMTVTGLWVLVNVAFYYALSFSIACITGSRSYTIGIILAFRAAVTPLVAAVGALGAFRDAIPGVAFASLAPDRFFKAFSPAGKVVSMSGWAALAVLLLWTTVAIGAGLWCDTRRDA